MSAAALKLPNRMTVDEFLAWDAPGRWQLVDGEAVAMAPASGRHAAIQGEIGALLRNHLLARNSPCSMLIAPGVVPRVGTDSNVRIPDIAVSCGPLSSAPIVTDTVLLVEILSPSNEVQTRANVWAYTSIPAVEEILLVRATRMEAELFRRQPDGTWPERPVVLSGAADLTLDSIGLTVALAAFYRTVT